VPERVEGPAPVEGGERDAELRVRRRRDIVRVKATADLALLFDCLLNGTLCRELTPQVERERIKESRAPRASDDRSSVPTHVRWWPPEAFLTGSL
jgi:hypothetical protein